MQQPLHKDVITTGQFEAERRLRHAAEQKLRDRDAELAALKQKFDKELAAKQKELEAALEDKAKTHREIEKLQKKRCYAGERVGRDGFTDLRRVLNFMFPHLGPWWTHQRRTESEAHAYQAYVAHLPFIVGIWLDKSQSFLTSFGPAKRHAVENSEVLPVDYGKCLTRQGVILDAVRQN